MTTFLSHIPTHTTPNTKCIIMLHGVGSNEKDLFDLKQHFGEEHYIFSLRGPFELGHDSYAWFPVDFSTGQPVYETADVEKGYEYIMRCIREITEQHDIDPEQVYLMGFSQGAIMSYYALWRSPELIRGIIALSGRLLAEIDTTSIESARYAGKRVFIGHGTQDRIMSVSASERTSGFVRDIGLEPTLKHYPIAHSISHDEMDDIIGWL